MGSILPCLLGILTINYLPFHVYQALFPFATMEVMAYFVFSLVKKSAMWTVMNFPLYALFVM